MKRLIVTLAFVVGVWPSAAEATPIFSDNFNGENGGAGQLSFTEFSKWDVGLLDDVELNKVGDVAPVPEPGSLVLFGTGLLYLGRRLRRRPTN